MSTSFFKMRPEQNDVHDKIAKTIIYVPVFNRKAIALLSIDNMRLVKGAAHLNIVDDCSTEFDGRDIVSLGDSGEVHPRNMGIDATRMHMLAEFFASDFDYAYFTDSDTIHDPDFLLRALAMHQRTNCLCGLYNTTSFHHKDGFNIDIGDDIIIRRTIPGVSMFFDKALASRLLQYYLDAVRFRPNVIKEARAWDWFFFEALPQVAMSRVSYLEHLYVGGLHAAGSRDLGANLTPFLQAARRPVFEKLGIPLEDQSAAQQTVALPEWQRLYREAQKKVQEASILEDHRSQWLGQAAHLCEQILEFQRNQPDTLNLLGIVQLKLGKPDAGLANLRLAVALANQCLDFHRGLAEALLALGRTPEAVAVYEAAVLCLPEEPLPRRWLSDLQSRLDSSAPS
jgi:hypothetical protein